MNVLRRLWCRLRGHDGLSHTPHEDLDAAWFECKRCGRGFWDDRLGRPSR